MKKNFLILVFAIVAMTACQQAPKPVAVDIAAEKATLDSIFKIFTAAFNSGDAATLSSFLNEDVLCLGTDPSEAFNKQQMTDAWAQMFSGGLPEINYIGERRIHVAADGNSATVVDQYMMPAFTKIPWRNAYHMIKTDGKWKIFVLNVALIPKNEDLPKIDGVIE